MNPKKPEPGQSLADLNSELANEWHPTRNASLSPTDVTTASSMRVWWKCPEGDDHEWQTSVCNRNAGWGCPICSGRKTVKSNSLASINPELADQWHPTKNGDLTPYEVSPSSSKKAWWKCPEGEDHEWEAVVNDRNKRAGCAICSNYKVVESNCLATLNPELAKEWHPTKNGDLTPRDVHPGSAKKVWWKCPNGDDHEWKTVVHSRSNGRGCPVCSGRKVVESTCLATTDPELAAEWHPTKNGITTPRDVGAGSKKKVWWKCSKGEDHEWEAVIYARSTGLGCPVCSNLKVVESNSLATLNPEIAVQWHPTLNGILTPDNVGAGSGKIIWWQCPNGDDHIWKDRVSIRNAGKGCPICIGRKVIRSNSFGTLFPEIAKQWHPSKNVEMTPLKVRPGSMKKVWWVCTRNPDHIWKTSIKERTQGTGCPHCNPPTSIPEMRIYCELKSIFPSTLHRHVLNGYEVDIYIPEIKLGIEYDGRYWHQDRIAKDQEKNSALSASILLLRVREKGLPKLNDTDIEAPLKKFAVEHIKRIIRFILANRDIESTDILCKAQEYLLRSEWNASEHFNKVQSVRFVVDPNKSISRIYPELVMQWHPTKNGSLRPDHFTPGSEKMVWWQDQTGCEWQATIYSRTKKLKNRTVTGQLSLLEPN